MPCCSWAALTSAGSGSPSAATSMRRASGQNETRRRRVEVGGGGEVACGWWSEGAVDVGGLEADGVVASEDVERLVSSGGSCSGFIVSEWCEGSEGGATSRPEVRGPATTTSRSCLGSLDQLILRKATADPLCSPAPSGSVKCASRQGGGGPSRRRDRATADLLVSRFLPLVKLHYHSSP